MVSQLRFVPTETLGGAAMEDYSIIHGQLMLELMVALLLAIVTSYAYISCKAHDRRMKAAQIAGLKSIRQLSTHKSQEFFSPTPRRAPSEKHKSSISDWLAPMIVWAAVIWTTLAVVSILLGEN
jgi:hypothetical protein